MHLNSIQSKIGGTLIVILLLTLGISFIYLTLQSRHLLEDQQRQALDAAHEAALNQARTLYEGLEVGAGGSLERGEMEVFNELLSGLGAVPGVLEVGLTNPAGQIHFSSKAVQVDKNTPTSALMAPAHCCLTV